MHQLKTPILSLLLILSTLLTTSCATVVENDSFSRNRDLQKSLKTYVTLGMTYLRKKEMALASMKLNKAYEIDPENAEVNNALALFYTVENEPELVSKHYKAALLANPDFSAARNNYGVFLCQQGEYEEALSQLQMVTKNYRYPKRFQSFENMGLCYLELKELDNAKKAFKRALELNINQPRSLMEMADLSFEEGAYRESSFYLQQLGKLKVPPTPRKLWLEIQLSRVQGNKNKLASLELALRNLFPNSEEYRAFLASQPEQGATP